MMSESGGYHEGYRLVLGGNQEGPGKVPLGSLEGTKRFQEGSQENPGRYIVGFYLRRSQVRPRNVRMGHRGSPEVSLEDLKGSRGLAEEFLGSQETLVTVLGGS